MTRRKGLSLDKRFDEMQVFPVANETARAAALTICDRATDADDARLLLEACGFLPYDSGQPVTYSWGSRS